MNDVLKDLSENPCDGTINVFFLDDFFDSFQDDAAFDEWLHSLEDSI